MGREERERQVDGQGAPAGTISFVSVEGAGGHWQLFNPLKGLSQVVNSSIGATRFCPEGSRDWKRCASQLVTAGAVLPATISILPLATNPEMAKVHHEPSHMGPAPH